MAKCTPSDPRDSCLVPASVKIRPLCAILPEHLPAAPPGLGPRTLPSGAIAQPLPTGGVMIWTNTVSIRVSVVAHPTSAWDVLPSLALMNTRADRFKSLSAEEAAAMGKPRFEICRQG